MLFNSVYGKGGGGGGWKPGVNTLAYWTLDNTLNDSSSNNRNLTMSGSLSFVDTGLSRKVLYCTGVQASNNYVYAASISGVSTITIHIWNKSLISFSNYRNLFTTSLDNNLGIRTEESSSGYMNLVTGNGNSSQNFRVTLSDADHQKWHLLSVTFDNSNGKLKGYINGELNVTGTSSYYNLSNWLKKFSLGVGYGTSESVNRYFDGYIGAVVLEDKIRTADEIAAYFEKTKDTYRPKWTPNENTLAYYKLDGNGNDSSGNGLNLSMNNVTYDTLSSGISVAYFNGGSAYGINTSLSETISECTQSIRIKKTRNQANETFASIGSISPTDGELSIITASTTEGNIGHNGYYGGWLFSGSNNTGISNGTWMNVISVAGENGNKLYINGQEVILSYSKGNASTQLGSRAFTHICIGRHRNASANRMQGYTSERIIEDKARTADQAAGYYNQTKANYGL